MMLDRLNASAQTWDLIWTWAGRVLMINLGVAVTNLPLLVALAATDRPWRYPLVFGLLGIGIGPSMAAAFGYLDDGGFAASYRRHFGRALLRWSIAAGGTGICIADILTLYDARPGAVLVPMLAVLAILLAAAGVLALALLVAAPGAGLRFALGATLRRPATSLLNLLLLAGVAAVVSQRPLLGLATLPGCALTAVWHHAKAAAPAEGAR